MIIGDQLRRLREQRKLSQGDIEKRTGLLRCYISRVENGHTFPAVETLEKMARALDIHLYQLLYDGPEPPDLPKLRVGRKDSGDDWGGSVRDARFLSKLRRYLSQMTPRDRRILMTMASQLLKQKTRSKPDESRR